MILCIIIVLFAKYVLWFLEKFKLIYLLAHVKTKLVPNLRLSSIFPNHKAGSKN
jgi:hypothetical protein